MIGGGSHQFIVTVETNTAIHNLLSLQEEEEEWGLTMYCWGNSQALPPTVAAIEFKETC